MHLPESSDEVRSAKAVDSYLKRVEELGFVQRLHGDDDRYEVKRILRAFVDGQWRRTSTADLTSTSAPRRRLSRKP